MDLQSNILTLLVHCRSKHFSESESWRRQLSENRVNFLTAIQQVCLQYCSFASRADLAKLARSSESQPPPLEFPKRQQQQQQYARVFVEFSTRTQQPCRWGNLARLSCSPLSSLFLLLLFEFIPKPSEGGGRSAAEAAVTKVEVKSCLECQQQQMKIHGLWGVIIDHHPSVLYVAKRRKYKTFGQWRWKWPDSDADLRQLRVSRLDQNCEKRLMIDCRRNKAEVNCWWGMWAFGNMLRIWRAAAPCKNIILVIYENEHFYNPKCSSHKS